MKTATPTTMYITIFDPSSDPSLSIVPNALLPERRPRRWRLAVFLGQEINRREEHSGTEARPISRSSIFRNK